MNLYHAVQPNGSNRMTILSIALFLASALASLIGSFMHTEEDAAFEAEKFGFRS
jgi:hypothetical protein